MRRVVIFVAVAATTGIVLALVDGTPGPRRRRALLCGAHGEPGGAVGRILAAGGAGEPGAGQGRRRSGNDTEVDVTDPTAAAWQELERALRFGATTIGDYRLLVRPRLSALAAAKAGTPRPVAGGAGAGRSVAQRNVPPRRPACRHARRPARARRSRHRDRTAREGVGRAVTIAEQLSSTRPRTLTRGLEEL